MKISKVTDYAALSNITYGSANENLVLISYVSLFIKLFSCSFQLRTNKKISVFWETGLKILEPHIFLIFFSGISFFMHLPFKMHKIIYIFQKT